MKKHSVSYNKHNHPSNHLKLKSILSILIIGIFIFLGFSSINEGDPETKTLNDCNFLHTPVAVAHKITFYARDEKLENINGLVISLVISEYDKMDDNGYCSLVLKNTYTKKITTNSLGEVSITLSKSYVSNDDELEIYFEPSLSGFSAEPGTIRVHKSSNDLRDIIYAIKILQFP
jgi:hypothetical protein